MSNIGTLAVSVVANTLGYSKGMKRARLENTLFGQSANRLKGIMAGLATTLSAGLVVRGLKGAADEMDKIGHAAKRLDMTSEALSGLGYAAEISESSIDGLVKGLTFLEKNLGSGKAADPLKILGLSVDELKRKGAGDALIDISRAMSKLPDAATKTSVAMKLFGKGGAELMPLLAEGPEKIRELEAEAAKLGLTFSDETAAGIDAVNDSLTTMLGSLKGFGRETLAELGPVLRMHADLAAEVLVANRRYLFGTELGPRQEAANKHIASMDDEQFLDFTRANPLGRMDRFLSHATRARVDKMVEQSKNFSGGGFGLMGLNMSMGMNSLMAMSQNFGSLLDARNADPAEMHRISNMVDALDIAGNAPEIAKRRKMDQVQGNSALEFGSAGAFSQAARSQQASQMNEVTKQMLKEDQQQTKALLRIDKNLANDIPDPIVNIA